MVLAVVALAVWLRSHSPGRAAAVVIVAVVLAIGLPRVLRAFAGAFLVVGVLLNTEILFGPPTIWLAHRAGEVVAISAATGALTIFNLAVIAFTRLLGWSEAVRDTAGRVLSIVPGRSPGVERAGRSLARINRRLLRTPRVIGLVVASVIVGPPTAVAGFAATKAEMLGACLVYAASTAVALVGVARLF